MKKVIIIGAGLGGLSAAIYLARSGFNVEVYEKNSVVGGKAGLIEKDGFRFDTGPSLLTLPKVFEELFEFAGEKIEDYLKIRKLESTCRYFYEDGTIVNAYSDIEKFAEEIENKTNDSAETLNSFLNYSKRIYDNASQEFLYNSFEFNLSKIKSIPKVMKIDSMRSMHSAISSFFKDEKNIQLFDRYATYNGSSPYIAPATLNIIAWVEHGIGGYYVENGIYEIPKALQELAIKLGVKFYFDSAVDEIICENNSIFGIKVSGEVVQAKIVLSNADVNFTYSKLLKDTNSAESKQYQTFEKSSSALVYNWGINGLNNNLDVHNILFSSNYKMEFHQLFDDKSLPDEPTIYINISSKYSPKDAPKDCENWFVLINAPAVKKSNWGQLAYDYKKVVCSFIG